jgi:hypothetical protein
MADPSELRVSDADRDRAARDIREHFAAGRLTDAQVDERVEAVYAATTQAELQAVLRDLPPVPPSPLEQRAEVEARRRDLRRRVAQQAGGGLVTFAICTAIWVASGANGSFWPVWVALLVAVSLLRDGWRLYGPAPELDRVEESLSRRGRRRNR